jgi:NAD(P)-dependent dehydrogenase (short-subunit alcohol dehydrogenase family)
LTSPLQGKTALVTGATNGIGFITARELARMGAQVSLLSRNEAKCRNAARQIQAETGQPVTFIAADLSRQDEIRRAAAGFMARHSRLHILVNNAGAYFNRRSLTAEGLEMTFALNHLGYFLLTDLLLDLLKASAPARIVNVASGAHMSETNLDLGNLQGEKSYAGFKVYARSKLCNILFTYALARRLEGSGVTANCLHPGYVNTGFARNNGRLFSLFSGLFARLFARTPEQGALTSILLASAPGLEEVTGQYFVDGRPARSSPLSYDQTLAERLWNHSLQLIGPADRPSPTR